MFSFFFFFFNDPATTEIYTLSLHDALPISTTASAPPISPKSWFRCSRPRTGAGRDRKSTRLNSSHTVISYAVFCLKKKKTQAKMRNDFDVPLLKTDDNSRRTKQIPYLPILP